MSPIARLRGWLARLCPARRRRLLYLAVITPDGCTFIGEFYMSKVTQAGILLALFAVTASGAQVTAHDGAAWSFSGDASVATLTPSEDGKSATLVGNGTAGVVSVAVTVDGFTKTDSFEFEGVVIAPPPAPAPPPADPIVSIDWTVTPIVAEAAPAPAAG